MIDQGDRIPYEALCMKNSIGMCTQLRNEMQVYYTVQSSELTCFKCWSALQLCVFFNHNILESGCQIKHILIYCPWMHAGCACSRQGFLSSKAFDRDLSVNAALHIKVKYSFFTHPFTISRFALQSKGI